MQTHTLKVKRALISVSDKTGLVEFARFLKQQAVEIISTGGTAKVLLENDIAVTPIETVTGNPEAFGGRMKTISFQVESALLYRRENPQDQEDAKALGIQAIDLVICNLYPFKEQVKKAAPLADLIENIDIGGPTMLRAAAKNFSGVAVCVDPTDYPRIQTELLDREQSLSLETRRDLALKAFQHTADYDCAIANELQYRFENVSEKRFFVTAEEGQELRYGENPHQKAWLYKFGPDEMGVARAQVLQGKALSYNNILDADAAWKCNSDVYHSVRLAKQFKQPIAVTVVKHLNPCGVGVAEDPLEALQLAWEGDPVSAFGSILCFSSAIDRKCVEWLKDKFVEIIMTPSIDSESLELLSKKKNLRVLLCPVRPEAIAEQVVKSVSGGLLVQNEDERLDPELDCVSKRAFPADKVDLTRFGLMVSKHLKSNAIALVAANQRGYSLIGAGMGQPNRVDSLRKLAVPRAQEKGAEFSDLVLISDAFLPFADNIDEAAKVGLKYIVQPGGSIRDKEVIAACDENEMAMIFTGRRHFRH